MRKPFRLRKLWAKIATEASVHTNVLKINANEDDGTQHDMQSEQPNGFHYKCNHNKAHFGVLSYEDDALVMSDNV